MIKILRVMMLAFVSVGSAIAAEPTASETSVRELIAIMQAKEEYAIASAQLSAKMQDSIRNVLSDKTLLRTPDQQKIVDDMRTKMIALFDERIPASSSNVCAARPASA